MCVCVCVCVCMGVCVAMGVHMRERRDHSSRTVTELLMNSTHQLHTLAALVLADLTSTLEKAAARRQ